MDKKLIRRVGVSALAQVLNQNLQQLAEMECNCPNCSARRQEIGAIVDTIGVCLGKRTADTGKVAEKAEIVLGTVGSRSGVDFEIVVSLRRVTFASAGDNLITIDGQGYPMSDFQEALEESGLSVSKYKRDTESGEFSQESRYGAADAMESLKEALQPSTSQDDEQLKQSPSPDEYTGGAEELKQQTSEEGDEGAEDVPAQKVRRSTMPLEEKFNRKSQD